MKVKSIFLMFVVVGITNILFSQNVTINAELLNNHAAKVELRSAYDATAPVYTSADITSTSLTLKAQLPQTDLYTLVFDGNKQFLLCLNPNDNLTITIDLANTAYIPSVTGSSSMLFIKQLTDQLLTRQTVLDNLNKELQNNSNQLYFSNFLPDFKTYIQSAQEADNDLLTAFDRNDSVAQLLQRCSSDGSIAKKSADLFLTEAIKHLKLFKNYYSTFDNHYQAVASNYTFNTAQIPAEYADFSAKLKQYQTSVEEHNNLIISLIQKYNAAISDLLSQYDDKFYDGQLDAPKAKLNFCKEIATVVEKYSSALVNKQESIKANSLTLKTLGNELAQNAQNNIEAIVAAYQKRFNEKNEEIAASSRQMMLDHKQDLATVMFLDNFSQDKALQVEIITALHERFPNHKLVTERYDKISSPQFRTAEGSIAPELQFSDPNGQVRKLSDLRGKVVLLDFWASWCGPCRRENPHVVAMYEKYHAKGFDVFSVSLDNNKERWTEAIAKDNLSWANHVSDLKGWGSAAAKLYGVSSIPCTFLLDKEGRIIAKGLRGQQLTNELERIFGE